jgi:hypothetical protein
MDSLSTIYFIITLPRKESIIQNGKNCMQIYYKNYKAFNCSKITDDEERKSSLSIELKKKELK